MLLRRTAGGTIAITQAAHAWLSGVLARAWGNAHFDAPSQLEAFCQAAGLHDIGWLDYDSLPHFDHATGLPLEFWNVPAREHTKLWSQGVTHVSLYSTYAAILVSMHGDTIYDKTFDSTTARPENAEAVRLFRADQKALRHTLIERLRRDPYWVDTISEALLNRHKLLLATVDTLSLNICWGVSKPLTIKEVPTQAGETTTLTLAPQATGIRISPWPFKREILTLRVEGKPIAPMADEATCQSLFARSETATIVTHLMPL